MKVRRKDCKYCGKELTEGTTKKEFCCDLHRVYWHRENPKIQVQDMTKQTNLIKPPETPKSNYTINVTEKPVKRDGESGIDYSIRLAEWKSKT